MIKGKTILRLGAGDEPKKAGYLNVDIRDLPTTDVIADIRKLPFKNGEYGGIENRNVIEHFDRFEVLPIMKEWARVVKKGGSFLVETVDAGKCMDMWRYIPEENLRDALLGQQTYPENYHKMFFTEESLAQLMKDAGIHVSGVQTFNHRQIPRMILHGKKN